MITRTLPPVDDVTGQLRVATEVMTEVVAEFGPDYVYQYRTNPEKRECYYLNAEDNGPDCLIAQVLWRLGWTVADLDSLNNHAIVSGYVPTSGSPRARLSYQLTQCLQAAQTEQDRGAAWGKALEAFEKAVAAYYRQEDPLS